jgi:hypothetical protein
MNMNKVKTLLLGALLGVSAQAFAGPTLTVAATPTPVLAGAGGALDVMINDVADLYAYEFTLSFDAGMVQVTGVSEGGFLGTAGATFGDTGVVDNAAGTISFVFNTLLGPQPGASGSGNLLHITFSALDAGTSALRFSDVLFLDSLTNDIAVVSVDGAVQAVPEPGSFLLFGAALAAGGVMRRRQLNARA